MDDLDFGFKGVALSCCFILGFFDDLWEAMASFEEEEDGNDDDDGCSGGLRVGRGRFFFLAMRSCFRLALRVAICVVAGDVWEECLERCFMVVPFL